MDRGTPSTRTGQRMKNSPGEKMGTGYHPISVTCDIDLVLAQVVGGGAVAVVVSIVVQNY
jgi:hypothetical protein